MSLDIGGVKVTMVSANPVPGASLLIQHSLHSLRRENLSNITGIRSGGADFKVEQEGSYGLEKLLFVFICSTSRYSSTYLACVLSFSTLPSDSSHKSRPHFWSLLAVVILTLLAPSRSSSLWFPPVWRVFILDENRYVDSSFESIAFISAVGSCVAIPLIWSSPLHQDRQ
ncbi:hypothetical protein K435DRAFT_874220 [Dendrothele bispora CBS 962.96]|uniref:Uncharacterized protein n=1 Tax=Dendrothele bispora (strain CBS 962.96) TaxID=1314807 RepID=A0A4S8KXH1_DENBC|nr:hypothetical protein K435DRAFT_874220 [Dendrothele bispora CBS 962.96]